ncbi:MAG: type II secretion system protein GspN [Desulfobacteraceae bacterium]|nr:type II secretion system protein GspN [Desulfobacteraceae bacterium]
MKLKTVLLYILLFIAMAVVFVFLLFPQEKMGAYLSRVLENPNSKVQFSFDQVTLGFPFKLGFKNSRFLIDKTTQIVPKSFDVNLGPSFLVNKSNSIRFKAAVSQGVINGSFHIGREPLTVSKEALSMSGVKIADFQYKTKLADIILGCELAAEYKINDKTNDGSDKTNSGQGTVWVQNFSAKMNASLFNTLNLPIVDFSEIEIEFTHNPDTVTITKCLAKGSIINVKLKGQIGKVGQIGKAGKLGKAGKVDQINTKKSVLKNAKLNLTGVILPDSPYLAKFANMAIIKSKIKNIKKDGIKFTISGTLKHPEMRI